MYKNSGIFKNPYIFTQHSNPSFGLQITEIDVASRLLYPYRISMVSFYHNRSNRLLPQCYANIDSYLIKSFHLKFFSFEQKLFTKLLQIRGLFFRNPIPLTFELLRDVLSFNGKEVVFGNDDVDGVEFWDMPTGHLHLLNTKRGKAPTFPEPFMAECRDKILNVFPEFFDKPFVSFHLRNKGTNRGFTDYCRNPDSQETYVQTIEYLTNNGFHVVGCGETQHSLFSHIKGYYSLNECQIDFDVLALFCLMKCTFLVGQQSSPLLFTNSVGVPTLITDAFPLCMGTFDPANIILFKHIVTADAKELSLKTIIHEYEDLFYGYGYARRSVTFKSNTSDEILKAVQEILEYQIHKTKTLSPEQEKAIADFVESYPKKSPIYFQKNRPCLFQIMDL